MSQEFLPANINKLRLELNKIRMQNLAGQLQNSSDLKRKKKELAQAYTKLTEHNKRKNGSKKAT